MKTLNVALALLLPVLAGADCCSDALFWDDPYPHGYCLDCCDGEQDICSADCEEPCGWRPPESYDMCVEDCIAVCEEERQKCVDEQCSQCEYIEDVPDISELEFEPLACTEIET